MFLASRVSAWTAAGRLPLTRHALSTVKFHAAAAVSDVSTEVQGEEKTESFHLLFKEGDKKVSPCHDIALKNDDGSYNMVRTTLAAKKETLGCDYILFKAFNISSIVSASFMPFIVDCRDSQIDQGQDGTFDQGGTQHDCPGH